MPIIDFLPDWMKNPYILIIPDDRRLQAAIDKVHKSHIENWQMVTRGEVARALFSWLDSSIDQLLEDADHYVFHSYSSGGFNDTDYTPAELDRWYKTEDAAKHAAQLIADLIKETTLVIIPEQSYKDKSYEILTLSELNDRIEADKQPPYSHALPYILVYTLIPTEPACTTADCTASSTGAASS